MPDVYERCTVQNLHFFLKCLKCTVLNRGSYKNIIRNICASGNIQLL